DDRPRRGRGLILSAAVYRRSRRHRGRQLPARLRCNRSARKRWSEATKNRRTADERAAAPGASARPRASRRDPKPSYRNQRTKKEGKRVLAHWGLLRRHGRGKAPAERVWNASSRRAGPAWLTRRISAASERGEP